MCAISMLHAKAKQNEDKKLRKPMKDLSFLREVMSTTHFTEQDSKAKEAKIAKQKPPKRRVVFAYPSAPNMDRHQLGGFSSRKMRRMFLKRKKQEARSRKNMKSWNSHSVSPWWGYDGVNALRATPLDCLSVFCNGERDTGRGSLARNDDEYDAAQRRRSLTGSVNQRSIHE